MTVNNWKAIVDAESNGQTFFATWRKQPTQATGANIWFDLSMSPGNPVPNYYIGAVGKFTPLAQSTDGGIPHGGNVSPAKKFLRVFEAQTSLATAVPLPLILCDYLGFYPFLDESNLDDQPLDNTVAVPRLPAGGVEIMPVVVAGQTGGQTFRVTYVNSNGVAGRVTPPHVIGTQAVNGTILSSGGAIANSRAPFMALQDGDTGVAYVTSIQFLGTGDIGLIALALVNPIVRHSIRGIDAPVEQDFFMDSSQLPIIADDAYLNLVSLPGGTLSGAPIHGYIKTLWAY